MYLTSGVVPTLTVTVVAVAFVIVSDLPYAGSVARGYVLLETLPSIEHVNVNASFPICKLSPALNPFPTVTAFVADGVNTKL